VPDDTNSDLRALPQGCTEGCFFGLLAIAVRVLVFVGIITVIATR
jgi:hypothetical protein